jgi:hypothetical protein
MVASVAKRFCSLYGNRAGGEEDIEDPAEHHLDKNEEAVDVFHDGDEDDEHMKDEEGQVDFEEDHDDEEQEAEEGNEGEPNTKKDLTINDSDDEETKTDARNDNGKSSHGSESNSIEDDDEINSEDWGIAPSDSTMFLIMNRRQQLMPQVLKCRKIWKVLSLSSIMNRYHLKGLDTET